MKKTVIILVLLLFIERFSCVYGYNDPVFDSPVRVGLFYNETAVDKLDLYCQSGFILGFKNGKQYESIVEIDDKNIEIFKSNAEDFVTLKENVGSLQEAIKIIKNMSEKNEKGYIFYDGNYWSIWIKEQSGFLNDTGNFVTISAETFQIILPLNLKNPIYFSPQRDKDVISLGRNSYRGLVEIVPSQNKKISVINEVEIEDYLYGVVPLEMPASWPLEALKAQAVASRTYALYNLSKWEKYGFDISASTVDQAYGGYNVENTACKKAVDETKGQYIIYDGKPILALYHADSGGVTEDGKDVFGYDVPYLKPVEDSFDADSPYETWQVCFSIKDISKKISSTDASIGEIEDIAILEKTSSGRVKKIMISGTAGNRIFTGSEIRNILQLKSSLFTVQGGGSNIFAVSYGDEINKISIKDCFVISSIGVSITRTQNAFIKGLNGVKEISPTNEDYSFYFYGHGCGHGLGMSQWGARGMAEQGYNYIQILQHYYKDIDIKK